MISNLENIKHHMFIVPDLTPTTTHRSIPGKLLMKCFLGVRSPDSKRKLLVLKNGFRKKYQDFKKELLLQKEERNLGHSKTVKKSANFINFFRFLEEVEMIRLRPKIEFCQKKEKP